MGDSFGGVVCFKSDVAIAIPPVSPRGSPPRIEPLRRCLRLVLCELHSGVVLVAEDTEGAVSVCEGDDMMLKE